MDAAAAAACFEIPGYGFAGSKENDSDFFMKGSRPMVRTVMKGSQMANITHIAGAQARSIQNMKGRIRWPTRKSVR